MVDVGFVVYGLTMSLAEGVIRVAFWAIAEHTKRIKKAENKGKIDGIDSVLAIPAFEELLEERPDLREQIEQKKADLMDSQR